MDDIDKMSAVEIHVQVTKLQTICIHIFENILNAVTQSKVRMKKTVRFDLFVLEKEETFPCQLLFLE